MTLRSLPVWLTVSLLVLGGAAAPALAAASPGESATLTVPKGDVTGKHDGGKSVDLTRIKGWRDGSNIVVRLNVRNVTKPGEIPPFKIAPKNRQAFCAQVYNTKTTVQSFCGGLGDEMEWNSTIDDSAAYGNCVHGKKEWTFAASPARNTVTFTIPLSCFPKTGPWSATAQSHYYHRFSGTPTDSDDANHRWTAKFANTAAH